LLIYVHIRDLLENSINGASFLHSKSKSVSSSSSAINKPSFKRSSTYSSSSSIGNVTVLEKIQKISPLHQKKIQSVSVPNLNTASKINLYKSKTVDSIPPRCQSAPPATFFDTTDNNFIDFYGNDEKENTVNRIVDSDYSDSFKPPQLLKQVNLPFSDMLKSTMNDVSFSSHASESTPLFSDGDVNLSFFCDQKDQEAFHSENIEKELVRFDMYTHIDPASPFALKTVPEVEKTETVPSHQFPAASSKFSPFSIPLASSVSRSGSLEGYFEPGKSKSEVFSDFKSNVSLKSSSSQKKQNIKSYFSVSSSSSSTTKQVSYCHVYLVLFIFLSLLYTEGLNFDLSYKVERLQSESC
jgi:hypothetical protein